VNTIRPVAEAIGFAIVLDGRGGIRDTVELGGPPWPEVPDPAVVVLEATDTRTAAWLAENAAFAAADRDALLGPIRRTWAAAFDVQGERVAVLVLEGLHHAGGSMAEAGDARDARAIVTRSRLILLGDLALPAPMIDRAREALRAGKGVRTPAELLIELARLWADRYLADVLDLDQVTAALEDSTFSESGRADVDTLNEIRRTAALLRRRAVSLRTAIVSVTALEGTDLYDAHGDRWRGLRRQTEELIELLDGIIERQHAVDDHMQNQISTDLSDRLYVLTLVSAVLLPLTFVTGLLGVNIGGIPLRESRWAFWILCGVLILLAAGQYWVVKRLRWLPRQDLRLRRRRSS
jgi:zinc transporter